MVIMLNAKTLGGWMNRVAGRLRVTCLFAIGCLLASAGCTPQGGGNGVDNASDNATSHDNAATNDNGAVNDNGSEPAGQAAPSLLYVLQLDAVTIDDLAESNFQWLVLEPSRSGSADGDLTNAEIQTIRSGGPCGDKTILAYLSIGEAEDYRDYWDTAWVEGDEGPPISGVAPDWLGPTNPDWLGNYKVRYWDEQWQALILGTASGPGKTPLDRIIDAGFDGVYLDIVDAYYFWSEAEGGEELTRMEARERMIEWVAAIATYARQTRGVPAFQVFPQNASDIIRNDDDELDALSDVYFAAVSGIGIEDLYYDETASQPETDTQYRIDQLDEYRSRDKTVLVTDYLLDASVTPAASDTRVADFFSRAIRSGYIPYAALEDRDLNEIATLSGTDWSVAQPPTGCDAPAD